MLKKYIKTAQMSAQNLTNGGILYLFLNYLLKVAYLIPLMMLWRTLMSSGVDPGMSLEQMLAYTYLGTIFSFILVVETPASSWFYNGFFISLYQRPLGVLKHLISQTVGEWMPQFLLFTIPMILTAPLFGVTLIGGDLWFLPSLVLCVTLGFAIDIFFICLTIRMRNGTWLIYVIRTAITALLSGSIIPFTALPAGIGTVFKYLPLGSLAGAPLAIYTRLAGPLPLVAAQLFWNALLWPMVLLLFNKTQERMVSYGG